MASNEIQLDFGKRIRNKRKSLRMSLRELAEKSQLTAGFLGQIERGESSPSVTTLVRIAQSLEIAVSDLIDSHYDQNKEQSEVESHSSRANIPMISNESPVFDIKIDLLFRNFNRKMEFFRTRLKPGICREINPLPDPTEQIIYILSGILKVTLTDGEHILQSGHYLYYDGNSLRKLEAVSEEEVVYLNIITPPVSDPNLRSSDRTLTECQ